MTIERTFDVSFISSLALQEKQIQQNYRPYIAVHKWFARRPGTLFRGLILSEFSPAPLRESFYQGNAFQGKRIADPFMGGGTPLLEANRLGCDVVGFDINPMSYWIVARELEHININAYVTAASDLTEHLESEVGGFYQTTCTECGESAAHVKYFLWVKTVPCVACKSQIDLFPGYLIAKDARHTSNVILCRSCQRLNEVNDRRNPGECVFCGDAMDESPAAKRNTVGCQQCGVRNRYPRPEEGPPDHRLFAIEYHCRRCRKRHKGRYFKTPDEEDRGKYAAARARLSRMDPKWIPDDEILSGDETDRLLRWGYSRYRQMFNARQLLGLELSAHWILQERDERIRRALGTNLSDLLRYQNMLCRYDTMALKSLDIFSVHGFPVGLIQCESNLIGIPMGTGRNVGSGGWSNIIEKYRRAKLYCENPFEIQRRGSRNVEVTVQGEKITDFRGPSKGISPRKVALKCASATTVKLPPVSLDGVFTDPPYFGNVQYAELMDFCYVWLRKLFGNAEPAFQAASTRSENEFTVNRTMGRGIEHFAEGMSTVFSKMVRALKPGAPFVFTYHHNQLEAYFPLAIAMLDSRLVCSAVFPCPAEMGGSIHINGTSSSIVDSVFVCRTTGVTRKSWIVSDAKGIANLVRTDIALLRTGGLNTTQGDIRCLVFGHLTRLAVWRLRKTWDTEANTIEKIACLRGCVTDLGGPGGVLEGLERDYSEAKREQAWLVRESSPEYHREAKYVSF